MTIDENINDSNVIAFPNKKNKTIKIKNKTASNVSTIINEEKYSLKKEDIIAGLIMGNENILDSYTAIDWMSEDYFNLYRELVDMVCENAGIFYYINGLDISYNKDTLQIVLISNNQLFRPIPIDINLLLKEDFSDITIELSYQGNIMFQDNYQGAGKTDFIPQGVVDIGIAENENYMDLLSEKEKLLILKNKSTSDDLISAIVTNFGEYIVSDNDIIDNLKDYSRLHLIDLLTEMIVDVYGEKYHLNVDPFSPILIQQSRKKGCNEWLEDIQFILKTNQDTYNTSIELYNSKGNIIFQIKKV